MIQGDFRNNHRGCHGIADMAEVVGGPIVREITGALFIIAYVLLTGSGILGVSIAFNVFSGHAICTNWFSFIAMILVIAAASFRKMSQVSLSNELSGLCESLQQMNLANAFLADRLADLGRLRVRLRRRLHRRRSRHASRPTRSRPSNRRLRTRFRGHRTSYLFHRHCCNLFDLCFLRRYLGLPPSHQRNARTA